MDETFDQGIMIVSVVDREGPEIIDPHALLIGEVVERQEGEPSVELVGDYRDK